MNKPVKPPQPQAEKDQDQWIQIGKAADEVIKKIADKRGAMNGAN